MKYQYAFCWHEAKQLLVLCVQSKIGNKATKYFYGVFINAISM